MDCSLLYERARIIRAIRAFFDNLRYLELDTPLLSPDLIPETCLEVFSTDYIPPTGSKRLHKHPLYLIPSPEIWMKPIIARHRVNVYQICKCFRNCESIGREHNSEFTMLEYYTMDADYLDSLALTERLFSALLADEGLAEFREADALAALKPPFQRLSMEDAFRLYAGFSLEEAIASGSLLQRAREVGLDPPAGTNDADLYNLIFVHRVEPQVGKDKPTALLDYPAIVPCLAALSPNGNPAAPTRERWELYAAGLELANCYSEMRDSAAIQAYFQAEGAKKNATALVKHAINDDYWQLFRDFPRCSGVALGVDRLIMALLGKRSIEGVLPFGSV
jgi:lysyl-tRNA synthetase class 2